MHQRTPGSLASRAIRAVRVTWLVLAPSIAALLMLSSIPAAAQISPGPLSRAHSSLTGTTQCNSCHVFGASTPTFKCLDCHKEVAEDLAGKHGYHFRVQMQNPNGKDVCAAIWSTMAKASI